MLYRKMFAKIIIIAVICIASNGNMIFAANEENIDNNSVLKVTDEKYTAKVTDAEYASIEKILEYINKEMKNIDDKISLSRTLPEYEKYPAVRLNIDTPYFGIYSIINSRLKIRNNVSTMDIASGYSIKNIVNKRTIKIESFEVSSIVVITRDVKIDKDMTSSDAQICIFKLLDYLDSVKSVNKFLDKQLTSMIQGYFSKEKNTLIYDINEQVKEIDENLEYSLAELSYISAITDNDISGYIDTLYKYREDISSIKSKLKSVLITETKLNEIYSNLVQTNEDVKLFRFNVNKDYLSVTNNIDLQQSVYLINSKMNNELLYLQSYIDNSKLEISQDVNDENAQSVDLQTELKDNILSSDQTILQTKEKEYQEIYKVASEAIIQNMRKDIDKANIILDKIVKNSLIPDEQSEDKEKLDAQDLVNQLLKIYVGFLNKENVFLTENVKANITEIKKFNKANTLNINSFEDIEYIYINIPDILTHISDSFVSNSAISNVKTVNSLKQVIDKVILCSENFKKQKIAGE